MSDYERNKVIRYRPSEKALNYWKNLVKEDSDDLYEILSAVEDFFGKTFRDNSFEVTCTYDNIYIDILLDHSYGEDTGEWGKIRRLYPAEFERAKKHFDKLGIEVEESNLKVVEYCYYNACEPDDYFDETEDPFYNEILF